jgi:hypothetical protein
MPIEATKHTAAGAKAFATFFVRTIDWGGATVSSNYMRHYMSSSCTSCKSALVGADTNRAESVRYVGGRFALRSTRLSPKPLNPHAEYTALVVFDVSAFKEISKTGKVLATDTSHRGAQFEVSLSWTPDNWRVTDVGVAK